MSTIQIVTGSWFAPAPDHLFMRIGISRGTPRGQASGYRRFPALAPGPWFKTATLSEYLEAYGAILAALDPVRTLDTLLDMARGRTPILCCFENAGAIASGRSFCHRHLVAQWFEDRLKIEVPEIAVRDLDRFAKLRLVGVTPSNYRA